MRNVTLMAATLTAALALAPLKTASIATLDAQGRGGASSPAPSSPAPARTQAAPAQAATATGNAAAGKPLYLEAGCYTCHGYNAQTGNGPHLQPPRLTQPQFIAYVRGPRTARMPAYGAKVLTDAQLADIYAYALSLPREPEVKDVPLLNQLLAK